MIPLLLMLLSGAPQSAQKAPAAAPRDSQPDDIVVEGERDIAESKTTTARHTGVNAPSANDSAVANRTKFEFSDRIARCAARGSLSTVAQLRAVIDDAPNKASQVGAQDTLVRANVTYSEGTELRYFPVPHLGQSIYDRGAFLIQALRRYAPDLKLTPKETGDPVVQSRFNLREVPRNRYRLPVDYKYFETAVCMVRLQPRLSVRLVKTEDARQIGRVEDAIVNNARICVSNAKRIYFDPTQFRIYIADAVYRWAVAAQGAIR